MINIATNLVQIRPNLISLIIDVKPDLRPIIETIPEIEDLIMEIEPDLSGTVIDTTAELYTEVRHSSGDADWYEGEYEATPKTATVTQIFPTADKLMRRNFLVYTIPTREEPNESGGVTFTIGE